MMAIVRAFLVSFPARLPTRGFKLVKVPLAVECLLGQEWIGFYSFPLNFVLVFPFFFLYLSVGEIVDGSSDRQKEADSAEGSFLVHHVIPLIRECFPCRFPISVSERLGGPTTLVVSRPLSSLFSLALLLEV